MKEHLLDLIQHALLELKSEGALDAEIPDAIPIERTRDSSHGDFATPICLALAKAARARPRELAERLVARLPASPRVSKVEIAGPGFINFFLTRNALTAVVGAVLREDQAYGRGHLEQPPRVQVEFVSANPTGPLHVGHGRGAAYGAALAALLEHAGYEVQREYYVNDAGRQMNILAVSVWLRYLEQHGKRFRFPSNGYRGDYIKDFARELDASRGNSLVVESESLLHELPADEPDGGDKEVYIDALIARCIELIGQAEFDRVLAIALQAQVAEIRDDLREFGVEYDQWFSERSLVDSGAVESAVAELQAGGYLYRQDGHLWFRSSQFGDEKDRVVVRSNGVGTYFASDIAYLRDKFARGFDHMIYIWGADHHGYIARLKAACSALGHDPHRVEILLVQFANLFQGGQRLAMSTRSGEFVTLRELREWVGRDAARFFYAMRRSDQHLDFDLDLARKRTEENPVFYVQYA
ncbi:MAG: arginine--tRNA ligase, partial [Gammaproteobacteria bacterium]|nr:arginine--tRNA ligase [Gammaproteobacteria bacterium]